MKLLPVVLAGLAGAAGLLAASDPTRGSIALVLDDPPVAAQVRSRAELDSPAARQARERILARQAVVRREAEARGFRVLASVQVLANVVYVAGEAEDRPRLNGIGGVNRLDYRPPTRRHLNEASRIVQAVQAWTSLGGQQNAGAGVKVAILDTGIDQTHPGLSDSSLPMPSGYPRCAGDDCSFTNSKVIVARSYVRMMATGSGSTPEQNSRPDDLSPRDRVGHGTGIAMIIAGQQVTGPGGVSLTGIAPRAHVGNYKVFGSPGVIDYSNDAVLVRALEDAFTDGMDIASLSLGEPALFAPMDKGDACGLSANKFCDSRIEAIENAVAKGMLVVISAGNEGDLASQPPGLNTLSAPGTAPSAITVGASRNAHFWRASVQLTGSDAPASLREIPAEFGDGPKPGGPMAPFPLRDVSKIGDPEACSSLPANSLAGSIALIARGNRSCFFSQKINNAQAAGARGAVFYLEDGNEVTFSPSGLLQTSIPAVVIPNSSGVALKTFLDGHADRPVILDPTLRASNDSSADTMSAFSSRGPVIGNYALKPELVAPGTSILTAGQNYDPNGDMFDSTRFVAVSGTSFAGPMVAGVSALVKQKNPGFTPAQIKSAVVNTATTIPGDSEALRVLSTGAGRLNADAALKTNVTVEPAVVSFGSLASPAAFPPTEVVLTLKAPANLALNARVEAVTPDSRAQIRLTSDRPDTVRVRMEGARPSPGVYHGFVVITGGAVDVRVPYLYVVGDGVPYATQAISGDGFDVIAGEPMCWSTLMIFKLMDRYGAPVDMPNGSVVWKPVSGGGALECAGTQCTADLGTDLYGISAACFVAGSQLGAQSFRAEITYQGQKTNVDFSGTARIRPAISANGVVDAASNTVDPARGLAPGSYAAIYGLGLSDTSRLFSTPYLPVSLSGVSVSFDVPSAGISVPGRLTWVGPTQVNVQIPWELEGQTQAKMNVRLGGLAKSAVYDLPLAMAAPQLYQYPLGSGDAAVQRANTTVLLDRNNPARRGEWVTLYANGMGRVTNRPATGEATSGTAVPETVAKPTITIGGKAVPAGDVWSGMSPGSIGLYQINVRIPDDAPTGQQPVLVNQGGALAQSVNIYIQ